MIALCFQKTFLKKQTRNALKKVPLKNRLGALLKMVREVYWKLPPDCFRVLLKNEIDDICLKSKDFFIARKQGEMILDWWSTFIQQKRRRKLARFLMEEGFIRFYGFTVDRLIAFINLCSIDSEMNRIPLKQKRI